MRNLIFLFVLTIAACDPHSELEPDPTDQSAPAPLSCAEIKLNLLTLDGAPIAEVAKTTARLLASNSCQNNEAIRYLDKHLHINCFETCQISENL